MKGGRNEVIRRPIAVQGLSNGFGIEILQVEDRKVTWRWTNEKEKRTSMLDETGEAFRTGRVWRRLADFEKVR
jgi:hypothetical protein